MVLKADGEIERKETAAVEAEAALERSLAGYEAEPPHAGRVKRSIAGAGCEPATRRASDDLIEVSTCT